MSAVPGSDGWYAAGSNGGTNSNFAFGRSTSNTGGLTSITSADFARPEQKVLALAPAADGSVVALGDAGGDAILFKLGPSGRLDHTFGQDGFAVTNELTPKKALVVQGDGKIVIGGGRHGTASLRRFTDQGVLDPSFDVDVEVDPPDGNSPRAAPFVALAAQPSGRLIALGVDDKTISGFTPDGQTDPAFGNQGRAEFPDSSLLTLAVDPQGKVYAGGTVAGLNGSIRLSAAGDLEVIYEAGYLDRYSPVTSLAVQEDGRLLTSVGSSSSANMSLRRHDASGAFDATFGSGGRTGFTSPNEGSGLHFTGHAHSIGVQADGAVVPVSGYGVGRIRPDGSEDRDFGDLAFIPMPEFGSHSGLESSAIKDGRLYLGGGDAFKFVVSRVLLDDSPPNLAAAWGWNALGQLGDGSTQDAGQRHRIEGLTGGGDVSAGLLHSLVAEPDGTVSAFGWNALAQLGNGTHNDSKQPVKVAGLENVVQVAAGWYHSMALKSDGTVWAWGWNGLGSLGLNPSTVAESAVPVRVPGVSNVTSISAGSFHSLASRSDGSVMAWGWNDYGQLGVGNRSTVRPPVRVPRLTGVSKVSGGYLHSLALKADGSAWAWGSNILGQLGDGSLTDRLAPVKVAGNFKDVSAGLLHSAAVTRTGRVQTWGWNASGQLGSGGVVDRTTPQTTIGTDLGNAERVSAGGLHTVALDTEGRIWTWGDNSLGQLGKGIYNGFGSGLAPQSIKGLSGQAKISGGYLHTLST